METKIQEFIKDFIPENITNEMKIALQNELECHIYDGIDYYKEIGFSEDECLEKALKDFCDDTQTKEQINNDFGKIHIPWSLADFFVKAIPIMISIVLVCGVLFNFLFRLIDIRNLILVPLAIWGVIILIKKAKRPHPIFKSIISLVLVVPYILLTSTAYFLLSTSLYKTFDDTKALSAFNGIIRAQDVWDCNDPLLVPKDIEEPQDVDCFIVHENSVFSEPSYCTWIFKYSLPEYIDMKHRLNEEVPYKDVFVEEEYDEYGDANYVATDCTFSACGFNFRTVEVPYEKANDGEEYKPEYDCWLIIGTNDEKQEIAYIHVSPYGFTPSFDEEYIKEECAWRYFYFLV